MVIRHFIKCATCGTAHTLRVSVGHNASQEHTFQCVKCGEGITIRMDIDFQKTTTSIICVENCDNGNEEGTIVNLSAEFPIPTGMLHKDGVFPWMEFMHSHFNLESAPATLEIGKKKFQDVHLALGGLYEVANAWVQLKKAWSLHINNKPDLAVIFLEKYKDITGYKYDIELDQVLFGFCGALIRPGKWYLFENVAEKISVISQSNPREYNNFKTYYKQELQFDHAEKYFEVFSNYFKDFSEYNQVLLYSKNETPIDESFHVSSNNFKSTKMFYGDAFEVITSSFTVIACLNNILNGRKFDEFETMNLAKYLTINKANRSNPFADIDCFSVFSKCIDSSIRNASHHKSMKINKNDTVMYRSPGKSNWKHMPYIKYLYMCNEIMLNICALQMIELLITYQAKKNF